MRSVFTIDLRQIDGVGGYIDSLELLSNLRSFGWEPMEFLDINDESTKTAKYKEMAESLFGEMPEIAIEEQGNVIFYGYLADDQTKFVVTRRVQGQITFRLLHPVLPRLQASTRKVVKKILSSRIGEISNYSVILYEKGHDHIILHGRVIPTPIKEAIRSNRKDTLLSLIPLIFVIPMMITLATIDLTAYPLIMGTGERLSTALITTSLVSALGLFQSYWEISRHKLIIWNFVSDDK